MIAANAQIVSAHSVERGNYGYVPADVEIQKRKATWQNSAAQRATSLPSML